MSHRLGPVTKWPRAQDTSSQECVYNIEQTCMCVALPGDTVMAIMVCSGRQLRAISRRNEDLKAIFQKRSKSLLESERKIPNALKDKERREKKKKMFKKCYKNGRWE